MKTASILKKIVLVLALIAGAVSLSACSALRAAPAEFAGFLPLPDVVKEDRERAPFHGYWVYDPVEYEELRFAKGKVYIAPVDTSIVEKRYMESRGSEETKLDRIEESQQLANYFREKLKLTIRSQENAEVTFVDEPSDDALTVNLALVEVVPTNPGVNVVGTAAGFFVPGGGLIKTFGEGSVAMEGFVSREPGLRQPLEQYKDREGQKYSAFTIKDYQRYAHIRGVLDDWSQQIVALLTTEHDTQIEDSDLVSVNPL